MKQFIMMVALAICSGCASCNNGYNPGLLGGAFQAVGGTLQLVDKVLWGNQPPVTRTVQQVTAAKIVCEPPGSDGVIRCNEVQAAVTQTVVPVQTVVVVQQAQPTFVYMFNLPFAPGFGWDRAYYLSNNPHVVHVIGKNGRHHEFQEHNGKWHRM